MNGHPKAAYGFKFVDSPREQKSHYEFNHTIIFVDEEGNEWSEYLVCIEIFRLLRECVSIQGVCDYLNDLGIPVPHAGKALKGRSVAGLWLPGTIHQIASNPI